MYVIGTHLSQDNMLIAIGSIQFNEFSWIKPRKISLQYIKVLFIPVDLMMIFSCAIYFMFRINFGIEQFH